MNNTTHNLRALVRCVCHFERRHIFRTTVLEATNANAQKKHFFSDMFRKI